MQLVRDWASLGADDGERLRQTHDAFVAEQVEALRGVRELYISQLQRLAEALMTRT
eukprot:CAMPEP_0114173406 /NCGR_PEP_ID=MMETSP0043_2-20121206/35817_1 /TAXON_ID=464988 /ORGANISM="Hemiselmis andersenii, Strain CCMP644" /LENGTH=55 /DNA_ID=CAMNT_0001271397 /DNA_START=38 /DNA_END=202 /DNA_ORIENTATION=-